jgi:hypothetical protein
MSVPVCQTVQHSIPENSDHRNSYHTAKLQLPCIQENLHNPESHSFNTNVIKP